MMAGDRTDPGSGRHEPDHATTRHLRSALAGERASLNWIVDRFDPCLYAAARHHCAGRLSRYVDPGDLVNEVWAVVLRRLDELGTEAPAGTAMFLRFLSTTLRHLLNNLLRKHLRDSGRVLDPPASAIGDPLDRLPAQISGVTTKVHLREIRERFLDRLDALEERDREIVVLRGLEQLDNREVGVILGIEPGTVAVRFHRALAKLRTLLPESVFTDLAEA